MRSSHLLCLFLFLFFFIDPPPTEIYTLSLHDALPISVDSPSDLDQIACVGPGRVFTVGRHMLALDVDDADFGGRRDRKSTRLNSSHITISYAVFCLKKKKKKKYKKQQNHRIKQ